MSTLVGRSLGRYHLVECLGASGRGEVYRAQQEGLNREVAVRTLYGPLLEKPQVLERFRREARLTAQLSHPHLLTCYDSGRDGPIRYSVVELLSRESLQDRVAQKGGLSPEEGLEIAVGLQDVLAYLHRNEVFHLALAPDQVRFDRQGRPILGGLGLQVETVQEVGVGESDPNFAAPEVHLREKLDARADIFSFGALLYFMFSGRTPFLGGPDLNAYALKSQPEIPPLRKFNSKVSKELQDRIHACLELQREDRPRSIDELSKELQRFLRKVQIRSVAKAETRANASPEAPSLPRPADTTRMPRPQDEPSTPGLLEQLGLKGKDRAESRLRWALLAIPPLAILGLASLYVLLKAPEAPPVQILEAVHRLEPGRVEITWKTDQPSFGIVELRAEGAPPRRLGPTPKSAKIQTLAAEKLAPSTLYKYRIAASAQAQFESPRFSSERSFRTEEAMEIQGLMHEVLGPSSARVTWRTPLPADTKIRYWSGNQEKQVQEDPNQRSTKEHRILLTGLEAGGEWSYQVESKAVTTGKLAESSIQTFRIGSH